MFKPVHPFIARAKDQLIKLQLWAEQPPVQTERERKTPRRLQTHHPSFQGVVTHWRPAADRLEPRSLRTSGRQWRTALRSVSASRFFFYKCTSWRKALKAATGDLRRSSGGSSVASANANAKRRTSSYWVAVHFVFCRTCMLLNIQLVSDTCITEVLRQRPR